MKLGDMQEYYVNLIISGFYNFRNFERNFHSLFHIFGEIVGNKNIFR